MNRILRLMILVVAGVAQAQAAGGLSWKVPEGWKTEAPRSMRAATYQIPPVKGDVEGAEVAVFYFGPGQGGAVDANVKRWVGQFKKADGSPADSEAKTKRETFNGLPVTTVDLKGTYAGGGMMMAPSDPKPNFRLLGAIVEGPEGAVFFKLTGPEKTVAGAQKSFRKLLETVKKG